MPQQRNSSRHDEGANGEPDHHVRAGPAGCQDDDGGGDHTGRSQCVRGDLQRGPPGVEVRLAVSPEQTEGYEVHHEPRDAHRQHG